MLKSKPETPLAKVPDGRGSKLFYGVAHIVVRLLTPVVSRLHVEGLENVPRTGGVLLISNHIAWLDVPLVAAPVPRQLHDMAKIELFRAPVLGTIMRLLGAFAVRRGEGDRESLRIAERVLAEGEVLCIFPEGTRSRTGVLSEAHPGAALIALRANVPIVPVAVTGTAACLHGLRYGPFAPHVTVRFGKPFRLEQSGKRTRAALEAATTRMMQEIAALLPPEARGRWATDWIPAPSPLPTAPLETTIPDAELKADAEAELEPGPR